MKKVKTTPIPALQNQGLKSLKNVINFYKLNVPVLLLIAVISILAYGNGLGGEYLSADDIPGIVQSPRTRDFGGTLKSLNFAWIYSSAVFIVFNGSTIAFHFLILIFHIINCYLVMLLASQLFGKRVALYSSLIFCLLPSGSEAVFWISGMNYVFGAFFSLVCINLFFLFRKSGDRNYHLASLLVFLLSLILLQTPWMFTIPLMILCLDLNDRLTFKVLLKRWWQYGSFFVLSIGYWFFVLSDRLSVRLTTLGTEYYVDPYNQSSLLNRIPYTVFKTIELYVFPYRLSFFHEESITKSYYYLMVAVTILTMASTAYLVYKRSKYAGLVLAIFASIAPTFSPIQVAWFIAERYLYLGAAFFAMILSLLLIKVDTKFKVNNLANYVLIALLVLYSVRLVTRAGDFKSSKTLWLATQKTAPISYRVYNNLGDVYSNEKNWQMAVWAFKTSTELAPYYADAIHNLGYTYMLMGDFENAKKYLLESYQKNGRLYQSLEKLGAIEQRQGNKQKAEEYFNKAREVQLSL